MAQEEEADAGHSGESGGKGWIMGLVLATVLAGGAGAGMGFVLAPKFSATPPHENLAEQAQQQAQQEELSPLYTGDHIVVRLQPITTNLGAPQRSWARLEGALVVKRTEDMVDEQVQQELALRVQQDTLAFLRTISLKDLQGPGSLAFLRDDLNQRAKVRSEGRVEEFIILSLVVE